MNKKEIRQKHDDWLRDIMEATGFNLQQIGREAEIGDSTLRGFKSDKKRLLSESTIIALYRKFQIEPRFTSIVSYSISKDNADVSDYVKQCKQYVTDVCLAKGMYRNKLAEEVNTAASTFSRLFNNELPRGLSRDMLVRIREFSGVEYPLKLQDYLSGKQSSNTIPVVGKVSLVGGSDEILRYPETGRKKAEPLPGVSTDAGEAVELEGPAYSGMVKGGMLLYFNRVESGVGKECIDCLCVVEDDQGHESVKLVSESSVPGTYHLMPLAGGSLVKAHLKRASKVIHILQQ